MLATDVPWSCRVEPLVTRMATVAVGAGPCRIGPSKTYVAGPYVVSPVEPAPPMDKSLPPVNVHPPNAWFGARVSELAADGPVMTGFTTATPTAAPFGLNRAMFGESGGPVGLQFVPVPQSVPVLFHVKVCDGAGAATRTPSPTARNHRAWRGAMTIGGSLDRGRWVGGAARDRDGRTQASAVW
jgi:hypothetical protein